MIHSARDPVRKWAGVMGGLAGTFQRPRTG